MINEDKPVARLQEYISQRTHSGNQTFFSVIILDRDRCIDGMDLYAHPVSTGNAAAPAEQTQAVLDVLAERRRQVEAEGWTPEHDDQYTKQQLRWAALCYMRAECFIGGVLPASWPWSAKWWKPTSDRRNLVKAVGLLISEIERLDRAAQTIPTGEKE